ncbi:uncharacterized protein C1orf131 [Topomyia yanbarensis]|uniref:uncharacterized protein C1orf131 n=1 Tax=Topomyia yanbarensis TaxID=2498891 RepID=UPI00273B97D8|nr:uncharacterized protein C1orf131 [Topomyia yanbarensis]
MAADFIPIETKASLLLKRKNKDDFSVTIFEPGKAKANKPKIPKPTNREDSSHGNESDQDTGRDIDDIFSDAYQRKRKPREDHRTFDISRARKEVINFGISGFDKETKHTAKVALAIKLGAKPPKNTYRNYKEIIEERKREKEEGERSNRRRKGQNFGASKSFQQQQLRTRQKSANPGSVTKHYGVVNPKIVDSKRRKIR